jgi:hypothetical protein
MTQIKDNTTHDDQKGISIRHNENEHDVRGCNSLIITYIIFQEGPRSIKKIYQGSIASAACRGVLSSIRKIIGGGIFDMDLDYFQHVAETSSATVRVACRVVAIVAYGMIGSYALMTIAVPSALSAPSSSDEYIEGY